MELSLPSFAPYGLRWYLMDLDDGVDKGDASNHRDAILDVS